MRNSAIEPKRNCSHYSFTEQGKTQSSCRYRRLHMQNSGSTLLESVFALSFLVSFATGLFLVLYLIWARFTLDHLVHRAMLCVQSSKTTSECRKIFLHWFKLFLPFGELQSLSLIRGDEMTRSSWQWRLKGSLGLSGSSFLKLPFQKPFLLKDQRRLNLSPTNGSQLP